MRRPTDRLLPTLAMQSGRSSVQPKTSLTSAGSCWLISRCTLENLGMARRSASVTAGPIAAGALAPSMPRSPTVMPGGLAWAGSA